MCTLYFLKSKSYDGVIYMYIAYITKMIQQTPRLHLKACFLLIRFSVYIPLNLIRIYFSLCYTFNIIHILCSLGN